MGLTLDSIHDVPAGKLDLVRVLSDVEYIPAKVVTISVPEWSDIVRKRGSPNMAGDQTAAFRDMRKAWWSLDPDTTIPHVHRRVLRDFDGRLWIILMERMRRAPRYRARWYLICYHPYSTELVSNGESDLEGHT